MLMIQSPRTQLGPWASRASSTSADAVEAERTIRDVLQCRISNPRNFIVRAKQNQLIIVRAKAKQNHRSVLGVGVLSAGES
ncbi:hypothetical protein MA16_Dca027407 [Dendrobium catenatum]|uniref:Uncharacterized protein n=1 Tax=Dendrobium catenatum TaxID=906689 RepID=A0A2I0V8A6_9ASPA|nr:hypothetical protein MA16_Dca027407 [Dendrobium catenatum]